MMDYDWRISHVIRQPYVLRFNLVKQIAASFLSRRTPRFTGCGRRGTVVRASYFRAAHRETCICASWARPATGPVTWTLANSVNANVFPIAATAAYVSIGESFRLSASDGYSHVQLKLSRLGVGTFALPAVGLPFTPLEGR